MRTTITLEDDVFEAAKALSTASGKSLGEIVSQLIRRGLRAQPEAASKNGLPVFRVSADAPIIPSTRASELLAEEEL